MRISFIEPDGRVVALAGDGQPSLMRLAVENSVAGIASECGGVLACGACHIVVDDAGIERLAPATPAEEEMLACLDDRRPGSRLSCQLRLDESLDGLVVRAPGAPA